MKTKNDHYKVIRLLPIVFVNFIQFSLNYFNSTGLSTIGTNEELSNYVLLIEGDTQLAQRTMNRIANSMKCFNEKTEKKQHGNLLNLFGQLDASTRVVTFDNGQFRSELLVEPANSWSLPIVSLTCIAVAIPNIPMDLIDNMFKSVAEGLLYTHLVEEYLNREAVYVNIRKATIEMWHKIEENHKWLNTALKRSAYQGKTPREVLQSFANKAQEIVNTFSASTGEKTMEMENLSAKVILANSMFRVANAVTHAYDSEDLEITEHELFVKLSSMISHIIATCLTNLPRVIRLKCEEKTVSSVAGAADLLGKISKIVDILERRAPNMDQEKMTYIDE